MILIALSKTVFFIIQATVCTKKRAARISHLSSTKYGVIMLLISTTYFDNPGSKSDVIDDATFMEGLDGRKTGIKLFVVPS